jgi:hypothetical protein
VTVGGAAGICDDRTDTGGAGGVLMIASMLARSGSRLAGGDVTEGALFSLSLSKTCVASSSSSQSMSSLPPFFDFAFAAGCGGCDEETTPAGPGRVLAGGGMGGGCDCD